MFWWLGLLFFAHTSLSEDEKCRSASVVLINGALYHASCIFFPTRSITKVLRVIDITCNMVLIVVINLETSNQPMVLCNTLVAVHSFLVNMSHQRWHVHVICVQMCLWVTLHIS
jgi:hypothetical protein